MTLDEIIDCMLDLLKIPQAWRLMMVDAPTAESKTFRKNAVWYFNMQNYYHMEPDDTKAFIRNMHYIQSPRENQTKRQLAYVSVQTLQEKYEIKQSDPLMKRGKE